MESRTGESEPEQPAPKAQRLMSLDAYRGLIMLTMASAGFRLGRIADDQRVASAIEGKWFEPIWNGLVHQFSHVPWTGCTLWDLIQPSFMFMVGVSMPFSYSRRTTEGQSRRGIYVHVITRSIVLILMGVFLSSNWSKQTDWTFVNVLSQIGLGYTFLFMLYRRSWVTQFVAATVILLGYGFFFSSYEMPTSERQQLLSYLSEVEKTDESEVEQFSGWASHWNKHTNAAAAVDRTLLNRFPREEEVWNGQRFWLNRGGYQTLNFIPSIVTMLFGLMAAKIIRGSRTQSEKVKWLFGAGAVCFLLAMAVDTTIWPFSIPGCHWTICPSVKRIWTPTWAVFSSGWTFWMLGALYVVIDVRGYRRWAFPLIVVGMNSIAMYVMAQVLGSWTTQTLETHLPFAASLFASPFGPAWNSIAVVATYWLICFYLYRHKLFFRV